MTALNRKEIYAGSMVLFIGLFYMVPLVTPIFQPGFNLRKAFSLIELKMLLLSLFYLTGSILFLRKRNAGWLICAATLLNFLLVPLTFFISMSQVGNFTPFAAIVLAFLILLLMSFLFLFKKETRIKYKVNNKTYLLTFGLYIILVIATFML
jgi:hypothetical protein